MLRRNVDRKPHQIKKVLTETRLRKEFLGVKSNDEKKVVAAFIENNQENALKTRPKVSRDVTCRISSTPRWCD